MRILVALGLVLFCLLLLSPAAVGAGKMTITSSTLKNPVTLDGKWTYADEWTDGVSSAAGQYGWFVIKDDSKFLYLLVDHTSDLIPNSGDFGFLAWDQKNDGGSKPRSDDYDLVLTYAFSHEPFVTQGTGTGWGTINPASSFGILSALSTDAAEDPYSKKSHLTYEFQVPRSILDNSTVVTSIGFFAGAYDESSQSGIAVPRLGDYRIPDSWAQLTFSLPVPEFPSVLIMVVASVVAVGLVSRRRRGQTHVVQS